MDGRRTRAGGDVEDSIPGGNVGSLDQNPAQALGDR
jgi:hypothetical protein